MELSCPVSAERINEKVVRIIAFLTALTGLACLIFSNYWAILFLVLDFAARTFGSGKWSVLKILSVKFSGVLKLPARMTDLAPKKFAAGMGFAFCMVISAAFLSGLFNAAFVLTLILTGFALLESLFAICVGCYIYILWQLMKRKAAA